MESTTVGGTATFLATSANNFGETSDRTAAFESTTTKGGMSINIDTEASFATQASTGTEFSTAATSMAFTSSTCSRSSMNSSATSPLYTFTTPSPPNLHCCCRCCSSSYSTCNQCVRPSLQDASSCASFIQPPTPQPTLGPVESQTPKFQAPTKLVGSKYPERLALSAGFLEKQTLTEMLASLPLSEKIQLGFKQNDLIVDCTYDGQPCDETDFIQLYNPTLGNCYTFNSGWNDSVPLKMATKPGKTQGLSLLLNIQQNQYVSQGGSTAGVVVLPLTQNTMPFPEDDGLLVGPGYATSISISTKSVERLSSPYGNCTDVDPERNVYSQYYPVNYSTAACLKTCFQRLVMDNCGCTDPYYPTDKTSKLPVCSASNITQSDCEYGVTKKWSSTQTLCDCPDRCKSAAPLVFSSLRSS